MDILKKNFKRFLLGIFFIILFLSFFEDKNKKISNLESLPKNSQIFFADPNQKSRPEWPLLFLEKDSLFSNLPPYLINPQVLGALVEGYEPTETKKEIVEYIVEKGDNLWLISEKFGISLNTILWANNLNKNSIIQPGQKLIIPPTNGVIHQVKEGETISEIAQKYKGKVEEIIAFNELSSEGDIYVGDIIFVPNGVMPSPVTDFTPKITPVPSSYFICPVSGGCKITQGLHWYNAVDFSNGKCGEPILAAAGGKVLKVKLTNSTSKWAFGGIGNHLTILHPNGVVTTYGHLLTSFVNPGDEVSQGQTIALMGGQPGTPGAGKSTGCHLHFGVSGAKNPFAY